MMKTLIALFFLAMATVSLCAETFTTSDGEQISGEVKRVEPDGIVLITDSGVHKVKFKELPADVSQKYGYDPAKAEQFKAQLLATDALEKQKNELFFKQKEKLKSLEELKKIVEFTDWNVIQVIDKGVLAQKVPAQYYGFVIYYLEGVQGVVEGNQLHEQFVRNGSYSYTDTAGASRTIAKMTWIGAL